MSKPFSFLELAGSRQSVRKYSDKNVEPEKIARCIEAARLAPSACNSQPWKFIIVDQPDKRNEIAIAASSKGGFFNKFALQAPVMVVIVIEKPKMISQVGGRILDKDFYLFDIGIAAEHFCLQAAEEGLGSCMIGWFDERKIKKVLNIPANRKIGLLISLGYAAEGYRLREKSRKKSGQISGFNKYN